MWCPDDTDYVEFNVFPDDPVYSSKDSECHHRPSLISAVWAKGGQSKIYNIDPSYKSLQDFYEDPIRISPYEVYETLKRIGDDVVNENYISNYSWEPHMTI